MRAKAYLAAPIFTPEQLSVVNGIHAILEDNGFEVFNPYRASRTIWLGRAPKDCTPEERARVLTGNIENLLFPTELLVAWVGGTANGKVDTGVAWEMGFFRARRVLAAAMAHTIAYIDPADERQAMNLMLAGTVDAVAYGLPELNATIKMYCTAGPQAMNAGYHPERLPQEADKIR